MQTPKSKHLRKGEILIRVRDGYFCKERERGTLNMKVRCRSYLFLLNYGKSRQIDEERERATRTATLIY